MMSVDIQSSTMRRIAKMYEERGVMGSILRRKPIAEANSHLTGLRMPYGVSWVVLPT